MTSTKLNNADARKKISFKKLFYIAVIAIIFVLLLYFTIFSPSEEPPYIPPDHTHIEKAKALCGTTLTSCCGSTTCGFDTAFDIAKTLKNQMCLTSIANTCEFLRIKGCNISALKAGLYDMTLEAEGNFTELCDTIYYDRIKCKYVAKDSPDCESGKKKVTYECIDKNGLEHPGDSCVSQEEL